MEKIYDVSGSKIWYPDIRNINGMSVKAEKKGEDLWEHLL